ncbi:hypothetical protein [Nitrosopumilus sp.]|uniref:hypothetical protein n=1 Tax=Nitrosopumilus sp. TaxID=2024843 RepID=UPI003D101E8D
MNCFVCSKKKEDFEVWSNKIVISATYDSKVQDHNAIQKLSIHDVICHNCMQKILDDVDKTRV